MSNVVSKARDMAIAAHGSQMYGDKPYSFHLDMVAKICDTTLPQDVLSLYRENILTLAYLHDTLEDTDLSADEVEKEFGSFIRCCVELLTDPPGKNRKQRKELLNNRLASIAVDQEESIVLIVKAGDRLANVSSCRLNNPKLFEMYKNEQVAFYKAVHRMGLNNGIFESIESLFDEA